MEPQKYDVMKFVKENDEKLQRHYEKMKELEQRERELNFQQMYKKYASPPDDYKSNNTFPQTDTYNQNDQLQYQIITEPQRNNYSNNNQYVYEMNTHKNGMFNPLAPSSPFDKLQSSNTKSNFTNSQSQQDNAHPELFQQYKSSNMTGNFAYSNSNNSGGNANDEDFNYRRMKEEERKQIAGVNNGEGGQQFTPGGTGNSAAFQYGYNSNNSENKNQYHFSIENNNNNANNRSEGEEEGNEEGEGEEGNEHEEEDFKYKGIEELRKEIMKNSQNAHNNNRPIKQTVDNDKPPQEGNLYEESKYRSDEDDVNKIIKQQQNQQPYHFANNNNINNNDGRSSDDETCPNKSTPDQKRQLRPKQQPKPKAPTQPHKPQQKHKQYTEDSPKYIQPCSQYHPHNNPQYQYCDSPERESLPLAKKPLKRFAKKYNGKIDSVALLSHYESLWKRKSKAKKSKSSAKLRPKPPFNSTPSALPARCACEENPLVTKESKLKMHKLQFITAPLRYYYKV